MRYSYTCTYVALAFLLVVMTNFYSKRQFPSAANRTFGFAVIWAFIDIVLDVTSSLVIENIYDIPVWLAMANNTVFYLFQNLFLVIMFYYVTCMVRRRVRWPSWEMLAYLPVAVSVVGLLLNPFLRLYFYVDPLLGYVKTPLFFTFYGNAVFYIILSCAVLVENRTRATRKQSFAIFVFAAINVLFILIQYRLPSILLTSCGISLSITILYMVMQNPEDMLDETSGAFNRLAMLRYIADRKEADEDFQLIAVKINGMRNINKSMGLGCGNDMIRETVAALQGCAKSGWVFRFVGVIFVVITRDAGEYQCALTRVEQALSAPHLIGGVAGRITTTCCAVDSLAEFKTQDDVSNLIESLLTSTPYGKFAHCTDGMLKQIARRTAVEEALRVALATGAGFDVYFQPLYHVEARVFDTAEALLRFSNDELGYVSPGEFIPIAEAHGQIRKIGQIVLRQVCEKACAYDFFGTLGLRAIQINLSPIELFNPELHAEIAAIVGEYGLSPATILFEITEGVAISGQTSMMDNIQKLRGYGFRFVLDDYGVGYSNISTVASAPLLAVKLDRSMLSLKQRGVILASTLKMFRALSMLTVVEGVETAEELALLEPGSVDYIQGYYYARPMPVAEFASFIRRSAARDGGEAVAKNAVSLNLT